MAVGTECHPETLRSDLSARSRRRIAVAPVREQLLRGFVEQIGKRLGRDPYDYGGPEGVAEATDLATFSLESQTQIIQELWRAQHGAAADARDNAFTIDHVEDLQRLVDGAGIGIRAPRGRTLASTNDGVVARIVNVVVDLGG